MQCYWCLIAQNVQKLLCGQYVFKHLLFGKLFVLFCILYCHYLSNLNLCTYVCFCMGNVASDQLSVLSICYRYVMLFDPWCLTEGDDSLWQNIYDLSCIRHHGREIWTVARNDAPKRLVSLYKGFNSVENRFSSKWFTFKTDTGLMLTPWHKIVTFIGAEKILFHL